VIRFRRLGILTAGIIRMYVRVGKIVIKLVIDWDIR